MKLLWLFLLKLLLFLPWSFGDDRCLTTIPEVNPKKYFHMNQKSLNITLETSDRVTHQLSTHVFHIFLKEIIGYAKTQIKYEKDSFQLEDVIERLSDRRTLYPNTTINLEVWIPPDYDTYATEIVKECGSVSPPGRFGWFIPIELDKPIRKYYNPLDDPEVKSMHWRFFRDRDVVNVFDIDASTLKKYVEDKHYNKKDPKSTEYICNESFCKHSMYVPKQCENGENCALLLTAGYNDTSFVIRHINEDNLYVKVLWLGNNLKQAVKELSKSKVYEYQRKSLVLLHWTPSDIILYERDFISISFENSERMNFTRLDTVGYKYEMHRLVKMAWNKVEKHAKPLYDVLRNFKFEQEDFNYLLDLYAKKYESKSIEEIACEWMRTKYKTWMKWKKSSELTTKIYIGGIFPMTGSSYTGVGIVRGAMMAISAINRNSSILSDYKLDLLVVDGECSADTVMKKFIDFIVEGYYPNLVGVLGPACSDTVEPLAGVSKHYRIMVISYSAEGASFSNRDKYPYFFRTIGENKHYIHVYLKLLQYFDWKQVAALTEDGQKYTEYISLMQNEFGKHGITFVMNLKFPRERDRAPMTSYLQDLKEKRARIIIADVVDEVARQVMCEAYKLKMTAAQGYVWFLPMWLNHSWYNTDYFNGMRSKADYTKNENVSCTTAEMIKAITGYFSMTHAYFNNDSAIMQEGITVGQWRDRYKNFSQGNSSDYAGFAYDAVWTYAIALDKLGKTDPEALSDLHSTNTTNKLVKLVEQTDFYGVSGRIKFRGGPSRFSVINILQWYDNRTHIVGYFNPHLTDKPVILGGNLTLNSSAIRWFTQDGRKPDDGTLPSPTCGFQLIADAFNVECQTAMVIFNVLLLSFLIMTVCAVCLYVKVKYNKRVKRQKEYMEKLGLKYEKKADPMDLDKYEIDRDYVSVNTATEALLGTGAFGEVRAGEIRIPGVGRMPVAVKSLHLHSSDEDRIDFLTEAENMRRFDHKNIVRLIGVVTVTEPLLTMMEFMLFGDLKSFLLNRKYLVNPSGGPEDVSPKRLTSFAMDVARGLSYLAQEKFLHRDLACRNCLMNDQGTVKIGDFGMARPMNDNNYYRYSRKGKLPVRWMAPESISLGVYSTASDIWSYGVVIYEIITFGSLPFDGKTNEIVREMVENGSTLEIPKGTKPQLEALMKSCWLRDPKDRPGASEIVEFLANKPQLLTPCLDAPTESIYLNDRHRDWERFLERQVRQRRITANGMNFSPPKLWRSREAPEVNIPLDNREPLLGVSRSTSSLVNVGRYIQFPNRRPDLLSQEDEDRIVDPQTPNGNVCCSDDIQNSEV